MNKVLSQAMQENVKAVGMPAWSDADQTLARALQGELKVRWRGQSLVRDSAAPDEGTSS